MSALQSTRDDNWESTRQDMQPRLGRMDALNESRRMTL